MQENKCSTFAIRYSKDSKGALRCWQVTITEINPKLIEVKITHGLLLGVRTSRDRFVTKGKNLGKANATTPWEQACSDAVNLDKKQKDGGYYTAHELNIFHTADENGEQINVLKEEGGLTTMKNLVEAIKHQLDNLPVALKSRLIPMKYAKFRLPEYAKDSKEYKDSKPLSFPLLASPKLDGINGIFEPGRDGIGTRGGKDCLVAGGKKWGDICPQIVKALKQLNYPLPLNGEVYLHGKSLQEIKDACTVPNALSNKLQFHVFDIIDTESQYMKREQDMLNLEYNLRDLQLDSVIKIVPVKQINNIQELLKFEEEMLFEGYEGLIVRSFKGMYRGDEYRSSDALKLVRMDSMEVMITDIVPYENEPNLGKFVCVYRDKDENFLINPNEFFVDPGHGFTKELKAELLANKAEYIGNLLTITHRGFTSHHLPRIAKGENGAKAIRSENDL
jgi:DNA ligase-1